MKKNEVPQDAAILDQRHEISYAVDEDGRYVLTPSAGWDPANLANIQAWQTIAENVDSTLRRVRAGELSPLAFHMARNQMDIGLLARYAGIPCWRVRRHLKPRHYQKLPSDLRTRYAELFRLPADQLESLPDRWELPVDGSSESKNPSSVKIDFCHRQSAHCESGVTANLLSHHGQPLSEAMIFGIGGGLLFGYFPFVRINHLPLATFRTYPGAIFKKCSKRLGFRFESRTFRRPGPAMRALDEILTQGTPVGLQTGVYWLPYFPPALRFHFNAHNLVVCGRLGDQYSISDPLFETFMDCPGQDLGKARFAKGALAPKGRMYWITEVPEKIDLHSAVVAGIRDVARNMVGVPVPLLGTRGMRFLAGRMKSWPERLGRKRAIQHLGHLIRMQEEIGTGGGGFRFIYAAFLQEAADLTGKRRIAELAGQMTDIGDLWRQFALLSARNCKGREGANSSFPGLAALLMDCADREEALFRELLMLVR